MQRQHRLTRVSDIARVREAGRTWSNDYLSLRAAPGQAPVTRLAIAVPAAHGHAPARNRARRLLREAFRRHVANLHPPLDMLASGRRRLRDASLAAVAAAVDQLMARCLAEFSRGAA
ncbi:MAG: ribonuclease P protein component [Actinobacteria bacterium]|nr:ribonuclease P protein component [Actinomycetota bacterium]